MTFRMSHGSRAAKKNARCQVHSSRQPNKKICNGGGWQRAVALVGRKGISHASLASAVALQIALQSARRFVDLGRAVKAAVLAAQPLAQVGDLEALAQMVCELARE